MDTYFDTRPSKFTRGEKCIFVHLILIFVLILASTLIYIAHIYLVNHPGNGYLNTRRLSQRNHVKDVTLPDYLPIGILYINISYPRPICNTIHLRERWSIAPAHCAVIRNDPEMAQWLSEWRIKYRTISSHLAVTRVKRSIAHPHFNREDFRNNVGLLEHATLVSIHQYISFGKPIQTSNFTDTQENALQIGEWAQLSPKLEDGRETLFILHPVSSMEWAHCNSYMAPVVDIRRNEFCVTLSKGRSVNLYHGAALLQGYEVVGFFSWGERQRRTLPFVILHIADFKGWIQKTASIADVLL